MGVTLHVPYFVVRAASLEWDEASDKLDGNWRRLHRASTDGFSTTVSAAVEGFREPWVDEIKACAGVASGYHGDLFTFLLGVAVADRDQVERIRSLLPWAQHDAPITEG